MTRIAPMLAICSILLLSACQKELSFETNTGSSANNNAVYTLGTTGNKCAGVVLAGNYTNGTAVNNGNTVQIEVNVTKTGAYSLSTIAVAGISFSASGSFSATGTQTVTLVASGKPIADGVQVFAVTSNGGNCSFEITIDKPAPPATFSFAGAPSACTLPVVNGTYAATTAMSAGNTVVIKVDVSVAGSYNISTNTVNGFSFSGSGVFTSTGNNKEVTLYATGIPLASGTSTFTFTSANACSFDIAVKTAPVVTGIYSCKIDGVAFTFTEMAAAGTTEALSNNPYLALEGYKDTDHNSYFQIFINNNDNSKVGTGTYDEKHFVPTSPTALGYRIEVDYSVYNADLSTTIWNTSSLIPTISPNRPPFSITVTSISATRVKGTFSGKLTNTLQGSTEFKTVTEGVFDLPIQ